MTFRLSRLLRLYWLSHALALLIITEPAGVWAQETLDPGVAEEQLDTDGRQSELPDRNSPRTGRFGGH